MAPHERVSAFIEDVDDSFSDNKEFFQWLVIEAIAIKILSAHRDGTLFEAPLMHIGLRDFDQPHAQS